MGMNFITFRSVTPAQRAQRILLQAGIECSLQRTPRWMEEKGCGYCLRLRQVDTQRAVNLLRQGKLAFSKVYKGDVGAVEEWIL
ncbi:MAG: DUF3343 domain-containing protein [Oscillospiraceae bacterium]|nr:DUF3343 domain-containing protein [Oscillospiraceae bacterium]